MSDWSVVIPSASPDNLVRSVRSIFRTHPGIEARRVVVVDDGARDGAERYLPPGIRWIPGFKPFVFARNVNMGIHSCSESSTVVVMGDDVEVLSLGGFDLLSSTLSRSPEIGLISPGIMGMVGNPRQQSKPEAGVAKEDDYLVFVCVALPRWVWNRVGPLDEKFVGYGCEDCDYSWRVRGVGLTLSVQHRCVVRHDGTLPSTFRARPDVHKSFEDNLALLRRKWERSNIPLTLR